MAHRPQSKSVFGLESVEVTCSALVSLRFHHLTVVFAHCSFGMSYQSTLLNCLLPIQMDHYFKDQRILHWILTHSSSHSLASHNFDKLHETTTFRLNALFL